jgi:O-antigen ligase
MLGLLLILTILVWFPILFYQISRRGFLVLLIWLIIGPIASNVIERPNHNPFFKSPNNNIDYMLHNSYIKKESSYLSDKPSTINMMDIFEPTRSLIILFLVTFLADILLKHKRSVPLDRTEIWMSVFSLILITNVLFQSRLPVPGMHIAIDSFIVPFLAYYSARRLVTKVYHLRLLVLTMGYTGIYLIASAVIERLMHQELFYRVSGPLGTDNQLYIVIMTAFFMVMILPLQGDQSIVGEKIRIPSGIRWFVLCLAPIVILITWGRSNWLGLLAGIWVTLYLGRRLLKLSRKLSLIGMTLLLVPVIILSIAVNAPEEIIEDRAGNVGTIYNRFGSWILLLEESSKHPIFGIGLNNSRDLLQHRIMFEGYKSMDTAHNSFLAIFAELGIIGLLAYLAILASIVRMGLNLYRQGWHPPDRWRGIGVISILVAHWVPALTTTIIYIPSIAHLYVFTCIGAIAGLYSSDLHHEVHASANASISI